MNRIRLWIPSKRVGEDSPEDQEKKLRKQIDDIEKELGIAAAPRSSQQTLTIEQYRMIIEQLQIRLAGVKELKKSKQNALATLHAEETRALDDIMAKELLLQGGSIPDQIDAIDKRPDILTKIIAESSSAVLKKAAEKSLVDLRNEEKTLLKEQFQNYQDKQTELTNKQQEVTSIVSSVHFLEQTDLSVVLSNVQRRVNRIKELQTRINDELTTRERLYNDAEKTEEENIIELVRYFIVVIVSKKMLKQQVTDDTFTKDKERKRRINSFTADMVKPLPEMPFNILEEIRTIFSESYEAFVRRDKGRKKGGGGFFD
jgi:hypothetical protein